SSVNDTCGRSSPGTPGTTTDGDRTAAADSARPGPTTPSPTSPGSGSSVVPSSAASSTNTSEPRRSPGQDRWLSYGTPHASRPQDHDAGSHRSGRKYELMFEPSRVSGRLLEPSDRRL